MAPSRSQSENARRIQALGPCSFSKPVCPRNRFRAPYDDATLHDLSNSCAHDSQLTGSQSGHGPVGVHFPLSLALGAAPSGLPDLRIDLVQIRWGLPGDRTCRSPARQCPKRCEPRCSFRDPDSPAFAAASVNTAAVATATLHDSVHLCVRDCGGCSGHHLALPPQPDHHPITQPLSTAGALLLFSVLHRQTAGAVEPSLVLPGLVVAAAEVAVAAAAAAARRRYGSSGGPGTAGVLPNRGIRSSYTIPPDRDAVAEEFRSLCGGQLAATGRGRRWRRLRGLAAGLAAVTGPVSELLQRIMVPSALLSVGGKAWRAVHSSSAALAEAVADMLSVGLSYSCLARQIQQGRLPSGREQDRAWGCLHKEAAQRLARHLGDLPETPTLAPALAALQRCSIAAALAIDGVPLCGAADTLAACSGGAGGSAVQRPPWSGARQAGCVGPDDGGVGGVGGVGGGVVSGGRQLLLSFSYGRVRRRSWRESEGRDAQGTAVPSSAGGVANTASDFGKKNTAGGSSVKAAAPAALAVSADGGVVRAASLEPPAAEEAARVQRGPGTSSLENAGTSSLENAGTSSLDNPGTTISASPGATADGAAVAYTGAAASPPASDVDTTGAAPETVLLPEAAAAAAPMCSTAAERGLLRAASASSLSALKATLAAAAAAAAAAVPTAMEVAVTAAGAAPLSRRSSGTISPATAAAATIAAATAAAATAAMRLPDGAVAGAGPAAAATAATFPETEILGAGSGTAPESGAPAVIRPAGNWTRLVLPPWLSSSCVLWFRRPVLARSCRQMGSWQGRCETPPQQAPPLPQEAATAPTITSDGGGGGISTGGNVAGPGAVWEMQNLSPASTAQALKREQAAVEAMGLPLYGRADHAHLSDLDQPKGLADRMGLACRAVYLLAVFLPFLTLGVALLLLSVVIARHAAPSAAAVAVQQDPSRHRGAGAAWRSRAAAVCRRGAWWLLLGGCRRSGAAFIKWGQWAATRVDLFPDDFCEALSELHDQAPVHSFAFTRRQVERSFGVPLDIMFEAFDRRPVASGSIAQVHRALIRCSDGTPLEVAVKVVHPRVEMRIRQDFALLRPAASALGRLPSLRSLSLPETVAQFSCTMTAQADLRVEAAHLRRFYSNFARVASQVTTPRPLPGLVRQEVMVETWEPGRSVTHFIRHPGPLNSEIVFLGLDTYLKMLLQDNFVHTDLHPGNIMVRLVGPDGQPVGLPKDATPSGATIAGGGDGGADCGGGNGGAGGGGGSGGAGAGASSATRAQLVLLDFGLAEELTPTVRFHFISFLHHLLKGDGVAATSHLLRWTSRPQACPDVAALTADMVTLAATECDIMSPAGIDMDTVMKDVLRLARKHHVTIDSCYASLVISVCVVVGFATSLDPEVNQVNGTVPAMLAHALTGRVLGRLHS